MGGETTRPEAGSPFQQAHVSQAMHPGVFTCPPETPLRTVARMMAGYAIHCVVVWGNPAEADADGQVWGIVSDLDLVAAALTDLDEHTAGGTAASPVVSVPPDETLERAAQLMTEYGTAHLVVVDPKSDRPVVSCPPWTWRPSSRGAPRPEPV